MATGLLIVCVGKATKVVDRYCSIFSFQGKSWHLFSPALAFVQTYFLIEFVHVFEDTKEWLKAIAVFSVLEKQHQPWMQIHRYVS